jgi:recombinational DNA repair ATPase RecF
VEIEGFKSIRHLRLECRRINLFIGPPNTGKSNLLESLGMSSLPYYPEKLRAFARCQTMADLFYDQDMESAVRVRADAYTWTLEYEPSGDPSVPHQSGARFILVLLRLQLSGMHLLRLRCQLSDWRFF